jgi:hypothetical protein
VISAHQDTKTAYCEGVVVIHRDGTRTCSEADCSSNGALFDHSVFTACAKTAVVDCPRCTRQTT